MSSISMRYISVLLAAAVATAVPATSQAVVQLRLINAFDPTYAPTELILNQFVEAVKKASNGNIVILVSGPEVVPSFQQLEPTSRGVFDMMFTSQVYHAGTTSVGIGFYAIPPDPVGYRTNGLYDLLDKDYQRFHLKLLALVYGEKADTGAFEFILKNPIGPSGDLAGLKLRGTKTYEPFIESMGGSSVQMAGGEIYAALQKGVLDGAGWTQLGPLGYKWYEVAKYITRPAFGHSGFTLTINVERFNKLSKSDQNILIEEGKKIETIGMEAMDARTNSETEQLHKHGMQETRFDAAKFAKTMDNYYEGLWKSAESQKSSEGPARELHALARKLGLAK